MTESILVEWAHEIIAIAMAVSVGAIGYAIRTASRSAALVAKAEEAIRHVDGQIDLFVRQAIDDRRKVAQDIRDLRNDLRNR